MMITSYDKVETQIQFNRFIIVADDQDEMSLLIKTMNRLDEVEKVNCVLAGYRMYFANEEDRDYFLLAHTF